MEAKATRLAQLSNTMDTAGRIFLNRALEAKHHSVKLEETIRELEQKEQEMV
jgi:hypothetical protein